MRFAGSVRRIVAAIAALAATAGIAGAEDFNDYPTSARAEYVFGCLKANGETRQAIEQCSCSIDVVASLVLYDRYATAETSWKSGRTVPHLRTGGKRAQRSQASSGRSRSEMFLKRGP